MNLTAPTHAVPILSRSTAARTSAVLGALVLLAVLSGCGGAGAGAGADAGADAGSTAAATTEADAIGAECAGVAVVVNFGTLGADTVTECVDATEAIAASEALTTTGVTTEGSLEYGDQIVCRVNDRPSSDETVEVEGQQSFTESCASMPPAYAYWALWVKATPDSAWEYAQEGLGTLEAQPGQSVGLMYTTGTETPTPGS